MRTHSGYSDVFRCPTSRFICWNVQIKNLKFFINAPVTFLFICVSCLIETDWVKEQCFLRKVLASQVTCQGEGTLIHRAAAVTWIWRQAAALSSKQMCPVYTRLTPSLFVYTFMIVFPVLSDCTWSAASKTWLTKTSPTDPKHVWNYQSYSNSENRVNAAPVNCRQLVRDGAFWQFEKNTDDVQRLGAKLQRCGARERRCNHDRPELPDGGGAAEHPVCAEKGRQAEGGRGAESTVRGEL